ncbi:phage tail protein [uncultured Acinetobacter sp.]|uniref:phage tail protein n=1 Tax=uncultured Acinetobacter sp. TaxID=165433 RepID=UPI0025859E64|nr:phage tail protein [uncultured Acinetobacter sp.]
MAEQIYYSVFTKKGLELLTEAIRNGTKLGITSMAFGDGGGSLPVPNENFTSMVREVHRTQLNSLAPDPNNANWLRAEAIIASAVGGFNIRELGLYAGNVLVAYSNYPATYKPNPADGTARIMTFRMILQIDNTANFELVIDPDVVLATIQKVEDVKEELYQENYKNDSGTNVLRDTKESGILDTLVVDLTTNPPISLKNKKIKIPNGFFKAKTWAYNRDLGEQIENYTEFSIVGNGDTTHIQSERDELMRHIWLDHINHFKIADMYLDNTPSGEGSELKGSKEGQIHLRWAKNGYVDNLRFAGGDQLTYVLSNSKNVFSNNIKVDFQYRYPVGTSKSPLIIADFSEQCVITNSSVYAVSEDGMIMYEGDLADNDQADDSKWAFCNLYGLKYEEKENLNACMWQEGEHKLSNSHFFGMNYIGNGIGHGLDQYSLGTDIGCTVRDTQLKGVWNRSKYISIGGHFINIKSPKTNFSELERTAIHVDGAEFTASLGNYFEGNRRDLCAYSGGEFRPGNSVHSVADRFSSEIITSGIGTNISFLGISNGQISESAEINIYGNPILLVISNESVTGSLGIIGDFNNHHIARIDLSLFEATERTNTPLLTQHAFSKIEISRSSIVGYKSGLVSLTEQGHQGFVTFTKCQFTSVNFLDSDLFNAKYIDCTFFNCTNSPEFKGLNLKCDSNLLPSSARSIVSLEANASYSFPLWIHEGRGLYEITVGGSGSNTSYVKAILSKKSTTDPVSISKLIESDIDAIELSWETDKGIQIKVKHAGTYTVKLG